MRNSDSVLLIDCRMPNDKIRNENISGNPRQYIAFAENHPESLEVEGNNCYDLYLKYTIF